MGNVSFCSPSAMREMARSSNKDKLFIGGYVDEKKQQIVLFTGANDIVVAPFAAFTHTPPNPAPDFNDFEVIDYGQTVRLGKYEAASHTLIPDRAENV